MTAVTRVEFEEAIQQVVVSRIYNNSKFALSIKWRENHATSIPPSLRAGFSVFSVENITHEQLQRFITCIESLPAGLSMELDRVYFQQRNSSKTERDSRRFHSWKRWTSGGNVSRIRSEIDELPRDSDANTVEIARELEPQDNLSWRFSSCPWSTRRDYLLSVTGTTFLTEQRKPCVVAAAERCSLCSLWRTGVMSHLSWSKNFHPRPTRPWLHFFFLPTLGTMASSLISTIQNSFSRARYLENTLPGHQFRYSWIRRQTSTLAILDCCKSGLKGQRSPLTTPATQVLAACARYKNTRSRGSLRPTFTQRLCDELEYAEKHGEKFINTEDLFERLRVGTSTDSPKPRLHKLSHLGWDSQLELLWTWMDSVYTTCLTLLIL